MVFAPRILIYVLEPGSPLVEVISIPDSFPDKLDIILLSPLFIISFELILPTLHPMLLLT